MAATWNLTSSVKAIDMHEATLEAKRKDNFEASKFDPDHQRYGLFSYPGPLNIGCDALSSKLLRHRNPDGSVTVKEKNFLTKPMKRGHTAEVYFSAPAYQPGAYAPPKALQERLKLPEKSEFQANAGAFRPAGSFHEYTAPYEYQSIGPGFAPNHRSPDGKVQTGPKNFLTSNLKQGSPNSTPGLTLGQYYPHMADPYDRKEALLKEERARTKAKIMGAGAFKSRSFSGNNFTRAPELYSEDGLSGRGRGVSNAGSSLIHDAPWRPNNPAKTGCYDKSIGKFPEHMPSPTVEQLGKPKEELPWK